MAEAATAETTTAIARLAMGTAATAAARSTSGKCATTSPASRTSTGAGDVARSAEACAPAGWPWQLPGPAATCSRMSQSRFRLRGIGSGLLSAAFSTANRATSPETALAHSAESFVQTCPRRLRVERLGRVFDACERGLGPQLRFVLQNRRFGGDGFHLVKLAVAVERHVASGGERSHGAFGQSPGERVHGQIVAHHETVVADRTTDDLGHDDVR